MTFLRPKPFPLEKPFAHSRNSLLSKPFRPRVPGLRPMRFSLGNVFFRLRDIPRPKSFPLEKLLARMRGVPRPKPFRPRVSGLCPIRFPLGKIHRRPRGVLHSKSFPLKTLSLCSLDALHSKPSPLRIRFILARARDSCLRTASGLRFRMRAISPDFSPS